MAPILSGLPAVRSASFTAGMVLLACMLAACTLPGFNEEPQVYEGFVVFGFEVSAFHPCDVEETWWLHGDREGEAFDALIEAYSAATGYPQEEYRFVFVRVAGEVGPEGTYGHMGAYEREFTLTRFLGMGSSRTTCS